MAANPFDQFDAPAQGEANPFDQFDRPAVSAPQGEASQPEGNSSAAGAFARGAERSVLPSAAGIAGAGAAVAAAEPLIQGASALSGPLAPATEIVGHVAAAGAGALGAGAVVAKAQQWALDHMPPEFVKALGLDRQTEQQDEQQHPYASFAGEMAPNLAAFRPGLTDAEAAALGKTTIAKLFGNSVASRALPAAINAGQEAAQEEVQDGQIDPTKIAIAAGVGALSNRMTTAGDFLTGAGAGPVIGFRRAWANRNPGEPAAADMRDITPQKPGPAPAGTPQIAAPIDPRDVQPGDAESPIPTSIIAAGRAKIRQAGDAASQPVDTSQEIQSIDNQNASQVQSGQPDDILARNNWPQAGTRVTLENGEGPSYSGTVQGGFTGPHPAQPGATDDGINVALDNGDMLSAFKHEIEAAGVTITPADAQQAGLPATFATDQQPSAPAGVQSAPPTAVQAPAPTQAPSQNPTASAAPTTPAAPAPEATGEGTQASPIVVTHPDHVVQASEAVNTVPTEAQKEAGNYAKGHISLQGMPITIENPAGSIRSGVGADGQPWQVKMPAAYGYIKRTTGADKEQVDAYIGPNPTSPKVYVVDQKDAQTGKFDEHKVMLGFDNKDQALATYHQGFSDGLGPQRVGGVREMSTLDFKKLLNSGKLTKPLAPAAPAPANPFDHFDAPKLPRDLAHANPRYAYGDKQFGLNFASDIDRAAYITAQKTPSKRDADFLNFVQQHTGMSPVEVRAHGRAVRDAIKRRAKDGEPGTLDIPEIPHGKLPKQPVPSAKEITAKPNETGPKAVVPNAEEITPSAPVAKTARSLPAPSTETSVLDNIRRMGGIKTKGPDGNRTKEGQDILEVLKDLRRPGLINDKDGVRPDTIREALQEHGWFGKTGGHDIQDLYDLMRKEVHEGPQYHPESDKGRQTAEDEIAAENDRYLADVHAAAKEMGETLTPEEAHQIAVNVAGTGLDPDSAVAEHIERKAMRELYADHEQTADQAYADAIPFHTGEGEADRGHGEGDEGLAAFPGEAGRGEEAPGAVAGHPGEAHPTERDAEGLNQTIVPGAEKSAQQLAQAREAQGHGRAAARVPQKDAGGLFAPKLEETGDMFSGNAAPAAEPEKPVALGEPSSNKVAQRFREGLIEGRSFASITEARKLASQILGEPVEAGTEGAKKAEEGIELGVVLAARDIVRADTPDGKTFDRLVDLYKRQPSLGTRSSTSVEQQAYSTPVPLGFVADRLAGIDTSTKVYEPTAGNGALLLTADPKNVTANELNPGRANALQGSLPGATVTSRDAADYAPAPKSMDAVIANPPFGVVKGADGASRNFQIDERYSTNEIDHAIALKALDAMKDDGRAVLIVGGVNKLAKSDEARSNAYNGKAKRQFYLTLYGNYNVTDHFTVAGELYAKQGAGWPVDVIVIDGRGKSSLRVPAADVPRVYSSWAALKEVLNEEHASPAGGIGEEDGTGLVETGQPEGRDEGSGAGGVLWRPGERDDAPADAGPGGVQPTALGGEPGRAGLAAPEGSGHPQPADDQRLARPARRAGVVAEGEEKPAQVPYEPASAAQGLDTLVPYNMRDSIQGSLDRLRDSLEGEGKTIDGFVAEKLGYSGSDELSKYLSAEQADAVALAIDNMDKGAGFILGDQTGVGKGRVVASIIRYGIKSDLTPIFVTEKPNLYADMYRDLTDIGIKQMLGRDVRPLMTNSAESIPLNDDGSVKLVSGTAAKHNALLTKAAAEPGLAGHDLVFTTYNQMQTLKGERTLRMNFLEHVARGGIVIFDESHNAGGQGADTVATKTVKTKDEFGNKSEVTKSLLPESRASFARKIAQVAKGVVYSSATYAKRPDVMDLYGTTDMKLAVADLSKLAEAIQKGGVPMQQVVANMLADAGQYIRREKSFEGINYNTTPVKVDREVYNRFSTILQAVQRFSEDYVKDAAKEVGKRLKAEGESVGYDNATGMAGAKSTGFSAVMHNLIEQMLLAIKADDAANRAIEAIKRGEKPVITVANTMGSFLQDFVDAEGAKVGDPIHLNFNSLLSRYLERTRTLTIKKPWDSEPAKHHYLTDAELGAGGKAAYAAAKDLIDSSDLSGLPVSPIDWMRHRLTDAGHKVAEITGRNLTMDYKKDGSATLGNRPESERGIAGRVKARQAFNSGKLDAMILNQAGSTGLSLHASEKVADQRKRRMILAQAERNIDTHMQMLGRVNRTGQVVLPEYDQLVADVPAEKRPASVLAKKMASLNANTTATRGSALTAKDVPDFMNHIGDEVATRVMWDMPELNERLDSPIDFSDDGKTDMDGNMRKVTGRIPLLPVEEQEALYELLEQEYNALLAQKEAAGENTLEAKTLDLDAKTLHSQQIVGANGHSDSPFAAPVNLEQVDVKRQGKPMPGKMVVERAAESMGQANPFEDNPDADLVQAHRQVFAAGRQQAAGDEKRAMEAFHKYEAAAVGAMKETATRQKMSDRLAAQAKRFTRLVRALHVGAPVKLKADEENIYGVVIDVKNTGDANNPLALGRWKVTFALADASRQITVPMSQLDTGPKPAEGAVEVEPSTHLMGEPLIKAFDNMQSNAREKRQMITGNLLAGFDQAKGRGSIVNFTDEHGAIRQGILMPRGYDYARVQATQPVQFRNPEQVSDFLARGHAIEEKDERVTLAKVGDNLRVSVPQAKATGGRFYLDKDVLGALGRDFVSVGGDMRADVPMSRAPQVVEALQRAGAVLQSTVGDRAAALKLTTTEQPAAAPKASTPAEPEQRPARAANAPQLLPKGDQRATINGQEFRVEAPQSPELKAKREVVARDIRARLDAVGLHDVGVKVADKLNLLIDGQHADSANAMFFMDVISAAMDSTIPHEQDVNHEIIHALRDLGLFRDAEWSMLTSRAERVWRQQYDVDARWASRGLSQEKLNEEAIAEAYRDYRAGQDADAKQGIFGRIFARVRDFFAALRSAFTKAGVEKPEDIFGPEARDIFGKIDRAEVGSRPRTLEPHPGVDREPSFNTKEAAPANRDEEFSKAQDAMISAAAKKLGWEGEPTSAAMFRKAFLMKKGPERTELTRNAGLIKAMEDQRATPFKSSAGPAIQGTGEERVRGVAASMAANDKTGVLGDDQPTYNTADFKDQQARAKRFVDGDYEAAKRVAMGDEPPPYGVLPEFVYNEVAEQAERRGDLDTVLALGNRSDLITEATTMGQRIAAHGQRDELSAVNGINQVAKARKAVAATKGVDVAKATKARIGSAEDALNKAAERSTKKTTWSMFIDEIRCK